jgi:hypothetical protein
MSMEIPGSSSVFPDGASGADIPTAAGSADGGTARERDSGLDVFATGAGQAPKVRDASTLSLSPFNTALVQYGVVNGLPVATYCEVPTEIVPDNEQVVRFVPPPEAHDTKSAAGSRDPDHLKAAIAPAEQLAADEESPDAHAEMPGRLDELLATHNAAVKQPEPVTIALLMQTVRLQHTDRHSNALRDRLLRTIPDPTGAIARRLADVSCEQDRAIQANHIKASPIYYPPETAARVTEDTVVLDMHDPDTAQTVTPEALRPLQSPDEPDAGAGTDGPAAAHNSVVAAEQEPVVPTEQNKVLILGMIAGERRRGPFTRDMQRVRTGVARAIRFGFRLLNIPDTADAYTQPASDPRSTAQKTRM